MSRPPASLEEVLAELARRDFEHGEIYTKSGRSRRIEIRQDGEDVSFHEEVGWAVRAGGERSSLFATASGKPRLDFPFPEPDGLGLRLADPVVDTGRWKEPSDFDAPLLGEREGLELLRSIHRDLEEELRGARLTHARLEDGASESHLASSRGVRAAWRSRVAALRLEATWREPPGRGANQGIARATFFAVEREARALNPRALARRLAARLTVAATGTAPQQEEGQMLLAPEVATQIVAALRPLFCGPGATQRAALLTDQQGQLASSALSVIDDGRLAGGTFESPVDGEGMATRRVVLVEDGRFRQALLSHGDLANEGLRGEEHSHDERGTGLPIAVGCARRASWRDLPRSGPTHLYVKPRSDVTVATMVGGIEHGYYLIELGDPGHFDIANDRFTLPVRGFRVEVGRATAPIARAWLGGSISGLLHGIQAVGRDLTFMPLDGMIGSPTLLIEGLTLRGAE